MSNDAPSRVCFICCNDPCSCRKEQPTSKQDFVLFSMGGGELVMRAEDGEDIVRVTIQYGREPHSWYYLNRSEAAQFRDFLSRWLSDEPFVCPVCKADACLTVWHDQSCDYVPTDDDIAHVGGNGCIPSITRPAVPPSDALSLLRELHDYQADVWNPDYWRPRIAAMLCTSTAQPMRVPLEDAARIAAWVLPSLRKHLDMGPECHVCAAIQEMEMWIDRASPTKEACLTCGADLPPLAQWSMPHCPKCALAGETSATHAAQHDETGRMWWGPKDQIPKGYTDLGPDEDPESENPSP